jgi:hypothetical protein
MSRLYSAALTSRGQEDEAYAAAGRAARQPMIASLRLQAGETKARTSAPLGRSARGSGNARSRPTSYSYRKAVMPEVARWLSAPGTCLAGGWQVS